jgi:hypothetical protein
VFDRLMGWLTDGAEGPVLALATGLLAMMLEDREVADYVVRTPIPQKLLQRLAAMQAGEQVGLKKYR